MGFYQTSDLLLSARKKICHVNLMCTAQHTINITVSLADSKAFLRRCFRCAREMPDVIFESIFT